MNPDLLAAPLPDATSLARSPLLGACVSAGGHGALAIWRLRGDGLEALLARVFRPSRGGADVGGKSLVHGHLVGPHGVVDEVLLLRAPGAPGIDISTHGGAATRAAVERLLHEAGVALVPADELADEAAPGVRGRALRAEARRALDADFATHALLFHLTVLEGGLVDELDSVCRAIAGGGIAAALAQRLQTLADRSQFGRAFSEPPRLLITGAPNAGKSTLANRLLGADRSIVTDEPGTTRDLVRTPVALRGHPFELIDGAGLRQAVDPVELAGVARARRALAEADLVLLLIDPTTGDAPDPELVAAADVIGLGKADLVADAPRLAAELERKLGRPTLPVSGKEGEGVSRVVDALFFRSPFGGPVTRDLPAPFTRRQHEGILAAIDALAHNERERAAASLVDVLEESPS